MISRIVSAILLDARVLTDREIDAALTDAHMLPWAEQEWHKLLVHAAKLNRDEHTAVGASFTLTPGTNTVTIGAGSGSVTNFLDLRGVDVNFGSAGAPAWVPIPVWKFSGRGHVSTLSYRRRGLTLEILPRELATNYPMRIWYVQAPGPISGLLVGQLIDLPPGGDDYIAAGIAAKIRQRFEEDPITHYAAQKAALDQVKAYYAVAGQGAPEPIREASAHSDEDWGW